MKDIFKEARADASSANLDNTSGEGRLLLGVKIFQDHKGNVKLYDTSRTSYYRELTDQELKPFHKGGWRAGVMAVFDARYLRRIGYCQKRYYDESSTKNRARVLGAITKEESNLLTRREELINKYIHSTP